MAPQSFLVLAQSAGGPGSILIFVAMFAVMYLLIFRPQQKQMKQHRELIAGLKKGDEVITQGGIVGKIHAVTDREVQLEIASGVKIRVIKTSVQGKFKATEEGAPKAVASGADASDTKGEAKAELKGDLKKEEK